MTEHLAAFVVSLLEVGLRGFQQKNVQGNHYKLIALTSYGITFANAAAVALIARQVAIGGSWTIALALGTGAAIGMVSATWLHERYIGRKKRVPE